MGAFVPTSRPGTYLLFFGRIHPDKGTAVAIDVAERAGLPITIAGIVQGLNNFARRPQAQDIGDIDLNHTLDEAVKMARRATILDQVQVVTEYVAVPPIRGKADELLQVFVNLVTNAVQAMEGKGTLTLATASVSGSIQATVRDSGPGIPEAELPHVTEPFHRRGARPLSVSKTSARDIPPGISFLNGVACCPQTTTT